MRNDLRYLIALHDRLLALQRPAFQGAYDVKKLLSFGDCPSFKEVLSCERYDPFGFDGRGDCFWSRNLQRNVLPREYPGEMEGVWAHPSYSPENWRAEPDYAWRSWGIDSRSTFIRGRDDGQPK